MSNRFAIAFAALLTGCAALDKPTSDGVGIGIATALVLATTVPVATPLWVPPIAGLFAGKATHDYQAEKTQP